MKLSRLTYVLTACSVVMLGMICQASFLKVQEWKSGIPWAKPKVVQPGTNGSAPSDAIVLFDGKNLDQWTGGDKWIVKDGVATADKGGITTKQEFGDCQLHLEFASPGEVEGEGQQRGNSGVYFMGKYEVQVLDSYNNETYFDGQCGSIYKQYPPLVNACRKPGEWQTYDIIFKAPRFEENGSLKSPAYVTVIHNGVVIQNHTELKGDTSYVRPPVYQKHEAKQPIFIQYHKDAVQFRNIWIRELPEGPALEG